MNYRKLTNDEIAVLESQNCCAEDWSKITVKPGFSPGKIRNVQFAGTVRLGKFVRKLEVDEGIQKPSGLYNSFVKDCNIDDNAYVSDVKNLVHYDIQRGVVIENVNTIAVTHESTFGNGTELDIINEGGGRPLLIFDKLSAQIAYIMVFYRHEKEAIRELEVMIKRYIETTRSGQGIIGEGARITNSSIIKNVNIGEGGIISGTVHLEEGTIACSKSNHAVVGENVIAKKFIILSGSVVDSGSIIDKCFVGQGVRLEKQFLAENSAFFANSEGFCSEAVSIFAGPYTVTHHKSTLLIGGLFSFFNAGSGFNQSNHLYKLGPLHQGILERGCKAGSSSYMMWPGRVGAFSIVIGKHYAHLDTSDFPFSYLLISNDQSHLIPALNLYTVGTYRDVDKWPKRDRRKDNDKLDLINYDLLNPYTVGRILKSIRILRKMDQEIPADQEFADYKGIMIKRSKFGSYIHSYDLAVRIFVGKEIIRQLNEMKNIKTFDDVRKLLDVKESTIPDKWIDMAGMIAPFSAISDILHSLKSGELKLPDDIRSRLEHIHAEYHQYAWKWCAGIIHDYLCIDLKKIEREQLKDIINDWKSCSLEQYNLILKDAEKEFDSSRRIGYGIDGDEQTRNADFEAVRGTCDSNKIIMELREESERVKTKSDELLNLITSLPS